MKSFAQRLGGRYAFVVAGTIFVCLIVSAALRSTPGVLMVPLSVSFGWSLKTVSFSAAVGIFLYGMMGPFAAALMQRFGLRKVVLTAFTVMGLSVAASRWMTQPWQLVLTWGVLTGLGSGCVAMVFGVVVVNRWFVKHRGMMTGILTASTATGTLLFLPVLASLSTAHGWQAVVWAVAGACAVILPIVYFLIPERPASLGLVPYGAEATYQLPPPPPEDPFRLALGTLAAASKKRDFWLLFSTFAICGFTTNGLVGTHLISLCGDRGLPEVRGASLLAAMGFFDLFGTLLSGWLTDRFDSRRLLVVYYGIRGLALLCLPFSDFSSGQLSVFSLLYGLDWIATVPPTVRLATKVFGEKRAPIVFGWVGVGHQCGAALAAYLGGFFRTSQGTYNQIFMIAGGVGLLASLLVTRISDQRTELTPAQA